MKKFLALMLSLALLCCALTVLAENAVYTADYDITNDYMEEDEDTGAMNVCAYPSTPLGESGVAVGYAGSFAAFVDAVSVSTQLEINGDEYVYTLKVQCGTDECSMGNYAPVFTWSGKVLEATDTSIKCAAPEHATILIQAAGQFATNEEQIGYFGAVGYSADETTTDCPYPAVPSGERLLQMFHSGVFTITDGMIESYAIDEEA